MDLLCFQKMVVNLKIVSGQCIYYVNYGILLKISLISEHPYGPRREKTCLRGFANNTGADQPAHSRSLIRAFVIPFFESIIC